MIKHAWVCQYDNNQDQHEICEKFYEICTITNIILAS